MGTDWPIGRFGPDGRNGDLVIRWRDHGIQAILAIPLRVCLYTPISPICGLRGYGEGCIWPYAIWHGAIWYRRSLQRCLRPGIPPRMIRRMEGLFTDGLAVYTAIAPLAPCPTPLGHSLWALPSI